MLIGAILRKNIAMFIKNFLLTKNVLTLTLEEQKNKRHRNR
jgi:hypothetical protein